MTATPGDLNPDCRAGKCGACSGTAWSDESDTVVDCEHGCHAMTTPGDAPMLFDASPQDVLRSAAISADGLYRYGLIRRWSLNEGPIATFVMLNPSTADADNDDPTIRRCVGFAKAWGMAALHVLNLYAYRATDPRDLWRVGDPVGPENDIYLASHALAMSINRWPLVAAWGAHAKSDRVRHVLALPGMSSLLALGTTKSGAPRHPLYLPASAHRRSWPTP